jgi:hypothetical protein
LKGDSTGACGVFEAQLGEEEFLGFVWRGVAAEDQGAPIGGWEVESLGLPA